MDIKKIHCVVCDQELEFEILRDEICPSCGFQFGYDDAGGGNTECIYRIYSTWRETWIKNNRQPLDKNSIAALHALCD